MSAAKQPPKLTTGQIFSALKSATGPFTWMMGASSVIAGTIGALIRDNLEWPGMVLCLFFAITVQAATNVIHRYYDLKLNTYEWVDETGHTWRSTMLPILRETYKSLIIISLFIGLAIMELSGWWSVIFGAVLALCIWIVVAPPISAMRTILAPIMTFLIFGPMGVIGTSIVQSQMGTYTPFNNFDLWPPVYISILMGLTAAVCHIGFIYVNYYNDIDTSKDTIAIQYGRGVTRTLFLVLSVLTYALFWIIGWILEFRYLAFDMVIPTLWLASMIWLWWRYGKFDDDKAVEEKSVTHLPRLTMLFTLLTWIGIFLMFWLIGAPNYPVFMTPNPII